MKSKIFCALILVFAVLIIIGSFWLRGDLVEKAQAVEVQVPSNVRATSITTNSITWAWNQCPIGFYQVLYQDAGGDPQTIDITDSTSWTQTGLSPNLQRGIQVKNCHSSSCSAYSTEVRKYTAAAAPVMSSTIWDPFNYPYQLTWNWSANGNPANTLYFPAPEGDIQGGITNTSFPEDIPVYQCYNFIHTFSLKAKNGDNVDTASVNASYTIPTCPVVNITSLTPTVLSSSEVKLDWTVSKAEVYTYFIINTLDSSGVQKKTENYSVGDSGLSSFFYTVSGLTANTQYKFKVLGASIHTERLNGWTTGPSGSEAVSIVVTTLPPNQAPNTPSLIGPTTGITNTAYTFTAQATDPDNDNILYSFEWDDDTAYTTGYVSSGTAQSATHSWDSPGSYLVCAIAADASLWSGLQCQTTVIQAPPVDGQCGDNSQSNGTEWDYNQTLCPAEKWSLVNGNSSSICWQNNKCCGDDTNENQWVCQSQIDYSICPSNDYACCASPTNCVLNGVCSSVGSSLNGSSPNGHDNSFVCGLNGNGRIWVDCDESTFGSPKAQAGESNVGEYGEHASALQCCGDDDNEYLKTNSQTGVSKCCAENSDIIDASGNCFYLESINASNFGHESFCGSGCSFQYGSTIAYVKSVWSLNNDVRTGFKIYRNTSDNFSSASLLASVGKDVFEYCDDNVAGNTRYHYFVTVLYPQGESEPVTFSSGVVTNWETNVSGISSYMDGNNLVFTWNAVPGVLMYGQKVFKNGSLYLEYVTTYTNSYTINNPGTDVWEISVAAVSGSEGLTCWSGVYSPQPPAPPNNQSPNTPSNPSPSDTATCVAQNPTLSWTGGDQDGDSVQYNVYLCSGAGCSPAYLGSTYSTSYNLSSLNPNVIYRWRIIADDGQAQTAGPVWSFTTGWAPTAPTNFQCLSATDNSITLGWADNSSSESGFKIIRDYYSEGNIVHTTGPNEISWTDNGRECCLNYPYWIKATSVCGDSTPLYGTCDTTCVSCTDFSIFISPTSQSIRKGSSASTTITLAKTGGFSSSVSLSVSGLPSNSTASFSPVSCSPNCSSVMTISTQSNTPLGNYTLNITGTGGGKIHSATFGLGITSSDLPDLIIDDIFWNPVSPTIGQTVTFTVNVRNQGSENAGDSVSKYFIDSQDIGQDANSGILAGATREETFTWIAAGCGYNHSVEASADANGSVSESSESNNGRTETINIANSAPNPPSLSGPTIGIVGVSYNFIAQSSDPNCDNVRYNFDWGNDSSYNTDYVPSGTAQTASNSWPSEGIYNVCVIAADASVWSGPTCQAINITSGIPGDSEPVADFDFCLEEGTERTIRFTDKSADLDGTIVGWDWDFGDGETCLAECSESGFGGTNKNPEHTFPESGGGGTDWWNESWQYRKKIVFDNSTRGVLNNVPMLVKLSAANFNFNHAKSNGADIRIIDSDGITALSYEIESWNQAGQSGNVWVKIPQVDSYSSTDFIYLYYGNAAASDSQAPTFVWNNNFAAVYHFKETSGQHQDSTSYNNDSNYISMTTQGSVAGRVNGADEFDGTDDYISIPNSNSLNPIWEITFEAWVKPTDITTNDCYEIVRQESDEFDDGIDDGFYTRKLFAFQNYGTQLSLGLYTAGGWRQWYWETDTPITPAQFTDGNWHYVVAAFKQGQARVYKDGVLLGEKSGADYEGAIGTQWRPLAIGKRYDGGELFKGQMDEVRISRVSRSSDWVGFQYCSINNSCTSFGTEESEGLTVFNVGLVATDNDDLTDSIVKSVDLGTAVICPEKVPPQAENLLSTAGDYCLTPSHNFSWTYTDADSDSESKFQFQIDDNSGFSSPEINRTFDGLSYPSGTINSQVVLVSQSAESDKIVYNKTYYWRAKVFDSDGADSGWLSGSSFITKAHQYPLANFTWTPQYPAPEESAKFTDTSQAYGGAHISSRSWTFEDGTPSNASAGNPQVSFETAGSKTIDLIVTDSSGYSCLVEKEVRVGYALPEWREVEP